MKWKRLVVPLYHTELFFCIEKDGLKVHNKIKRLKLRVREKDQGDIDPIQNAGCVIPLLDKENKRSYLMWLPGFNSRKEDFDTLVHELTHVKNYIFKHIGQQTNVDDDEVEAYLMGWLASEFIKFWRT